MEDMSDASLRLQTIKLVLESGCFEPFHDTITVCRLATELINFVKTGLQPPEMKPKGTRSH